MQEFDLIIIGGGPAGLTAGLYAARARLNTVLFDKSGGGGWLNTTQLVENYPGFPAGISGPELAEAFIKQAERFGLRIMMEEVTRLEDHRPLKLVHTIASTYRTRSVIIASGSRPIMLNIPGEEELMGRGVSICATCDAALFEGREVAVIGGGNSAVDEAISISRHAGKVTIVHRRDTLRAEKMLQDLAFPNPKINFIWNTVPEKIHGEGKVTGLTLRNVLTEEQSYLAVDGVFVFIGTAPNTDFLRGAVDIDENGYAIVNENQRTSAEGVWAAGDVEDSRFRQAVIAAGRGASAALLADEYIKGLTFAMK